MKKIVIKKENTGQRLDKFLVKEVFCNEKITRGEIIREIKSGKILLNGKNVKASYILKEEDKITITSFHPPAGGPIYNKIVPNKNIKIKIIFENNDFLVIDKPAGIQIHPDAHEKENTVVNWLIAKYPKIKTVHDSSREAELRPGIVHRLDKDTSGVMVMAKNQKTFNALKKLFQSRKVKKTYMAIVQGILKEKIGTIETSLAKAANYKKQIIASSRTKTKIRPAFTGYSVLQEFKGYSLVEAYIKTGRTHQIRIHLWSIGHPVVGDQLYRSKGFGNNLAERQLLHAEKIGFKLGGKDFNFQSPLPKDIRDFIKRAK